MNTLQEKIGKTAIKIVELKDGSKTIVDIDIETDGYVWYKTYYGYAYNPICGFIHRYIMNAPRHLHVDHINGDRLDNRRENLRVCTQHQNNMSGSRKKNSKSLFKGVSPCHSNNKWRSTVTFNYKQHHAGYFQTEEEAAKAYDKKALELFGEFARLNFPELKEEYLKFLQELPKLIPTFETSNNNNMRTIKEIKDDVCLDFGYMNYQTALENFKRGFLEVVKFNSIVNEIGREVARQSLNNAANNAKITGDWDNEAHDVVHSVLLCKTYYSFLLVQHLVDPAHSNYL